MMMIDYSQQSVSKLVESYKFESTLEWHIIFMNLDSGVAW
jgi:hypothetical protein